MPGDDNNGLQSEYTCKAFPALYRIWMVMQEVANIYFASRLGVSELTKIPVTFAESKYRKLIESVSSYITTTNIPRRYNTQFIICQ